LEFDPAAFEDLTWWVEQDRKQALNPGACHCGESVAADGNFIYSAFYSNTLPVYYTRSDNF